MKKYNAILLSIVAAVLCACQSIAPDQVLLPVPPEEVPLLRNVLLTEFTGYKCVNCPLAAEEAHKLLALYPENLVVVAMHPKTNSFSRNAKLVCDEADIYYKSLGGASTTPFPTGCLDFSPTFIDYTNWAGAFLREAFSYPVAKVDIQATRTDRQLQVDVKLTEATGVNNVAQHARLLLWVVEDDIIDKQSMPDGTINNEYHHSHVLRGELLSEDAWGEAFLLSQDISFARELTMPDKVANPDNCSLVAVLIQDVTREVIDVKQIKL